MFKLYRVTFGGAIQKAIMYSMKRNGPGRHKSLTQFFFFFFFGGGGYFNEFLFRSGCTTFFYILTYEHVGKMQKTEKKTNHIHIADSHTITYWQKEKERNTPQYLLLYLIQKKLIKINNK